VLLDELVQVPDTPSKDLVLKFETKSLRDSRGTHYGSAVYQTLQERGSDRVWRFGA
jgi:hypothetical protein